MLRKLTLLFSGLSLILVVIMAGCGGNGGDTAGTAETPEAAADQPAPPVAEGTASVTGVISYQGQVPTFQPLNMNADPACAAKHTEPAYPEVLALGEGNTMGNVFVQVKSGLPEGQWPAPSEAVVLDQEGCRYEPHVLGVMVGQTLQILNSDELLHNIHALPEKNREFNRGMPPSMTETTHVFTQAEDMFHIKCDVHPWMSAYTVVMRHPYFAVTETDGQYSISGLPAGTYEIEAGHERLGTQTASVTVADGESQSADFTFSAPQ
ncbi:MAG: carboxypeptidase regulatory-like domain-containing protein [Acidobacteriota bacterium]